MVRDKGKANEQQTASKGAKAEEAIGKGAYAVGKRIGDLGRAFKEFKDEYTAALNEEDEEE